VPDKTRRHDLSTNVERRKKVGEADVRHCCRTRFLSDRHSKKEDGEVNLAPTTPAPKDTTAEPIGKPTQREKYRQDLLQRSTSTAGAGRRSRGGKRGIEKKSVGVGGKKTVEVGHTSRSKRRVSQKQQVGGARIEDLSILQRGGERSRRVMRGKKNSKRKVLSENGRTKLDSSAPKRGGTGARDKGKTVSGELVVTMSWRTWQKERVST